MRNFVPAFAGFAWLIASADDAAVAQIVGPAIPWYYNPVVTPYGYGYGYYPYGAGGGTAYSAEAQGLAEVIRAQGEFNKATAQARKTQEEARSKYIDNQVKWLQAYHEHQRLGEERRAKEHAEARARVQRRTSASRKPPELLGRSEFDAETGRLLFPTALTAPVFEESRERLQELFEQRTLTGATPEADEEIQDLVAAMLGQLRKRIETTPPPDYIAARSFLEHVRNEVAIQL